jgi:hypothetical protein
MGHIATACMLCIANMAFMKKRCVLRLAAAIFAASQLESKNAVCAAHMLQHDMYDFSIVHIMELAHYETCSTCCAVCMCACIAGCCCVGVRHLCQR